MPLMTRGWMGIDPGKAGGLAVILNTRIGERGVYCTPIPETDWDIWAWIRDWNGIVTSAVIEKVHSSPQMGVVSAFTFGQGYGKLQMALVGSGISAEERRPQEWQRELGITPRKKDEPQGTWKTRLRDEAQKRFPTLALWNEPKSKGRQLAVSDALLIALFCQRLNS